MVVGVLFLTQKHIFSDVKSITDSEGSECSSSKIDSVFGISIFQRKHGMAFSLPSKLYKRQEVQVRGNAKKKIEQGSTD